MLLHKDCLLKREGAHKGVRVNQKSRRNSVENRVKLSKKVFLLSYNIAKAKKLKIENVFDRFRSLFAKNFDVCFEPLTDCYYFPYSSVFVFSSRDFFSSLYHVCFRLYTLIYIVGQMPKIFRDETKLQE